MRSFLMSVATTVWPQRGRHHRTAEVVAAVAVATGAFLPSHPCFSVAAASLVVVALPAITTAAEAAGFRRMARTAR